MTGHKAETIPTEVSYIANHWAHLQPHVREAIITLIDGALTSEYAETRDGKERCVNQERTGRVGT